MTHTGAFFVRRTSDEVFDLLSNPGRFAPLLPDFLSMAMQDATHFGMRTVIAIGEIKGHANLTMELGQASRPVHVEYRGSATIAGSQLFLAINFQISPRVEMTEVSWQGEVRLDGGLALMAGNLVETAGRQNFDRMAERLQHALQGEPLSGGEETAGSNPPGGVDYEI